LSALGAPGSGMLCEDQEEPFHRDASGLLLLSPSYVDCPTAVHAVTDEQAMPFSSASMAVAGTGKGSLLQLVPFQFSASMGLRPTALHTALAGHDTDVRYGTGVVCVVQLLPFHRSASVAPPSRLPIAVQAAADGHATPSRLEYGELEVGVETMLQALPFQCSVRLPTPNTLPVATQSVGDAQETAKSSLSLAPVLGVGNTVQLPLFHSSAMVVVSYVE